MSSSLWRRRPAHAFIGPLSRRLELSTINHTPDNFSSLDSIQTPPIFLTPCLALPSLRNLQLGSKCRCQECATWATHVSFLEVHAFLRRCPSQLDLHLLEGADILIPRDISPPYTIRCHRLKIGNDDGFLPWHISRILRALMPALPSETTITIQAYSKHRVEKPACYDLVRRASPPSTP